MQVIIPVGNSPGGQFLMSEVADPCGKPLYDCTGLGPNYANLIPSHVDICIFRHLCFLSLFSTDDPLCHCFDRNKLLLLQLSRSWRLLGQRRCSSCFMGWNIFMSLGDSDLVCLFAFFIYMIGGLHELFLVSPQYKKYQELAVFIWGWRAEVMQVGAHLGCICLFLLFCLNAFLLPSSSLKLF